MGENSMSFASPQFLGWLLAIPALIGFYVWAFAKKDRLIAAFVSPSLRQRLLRGVSPGRQRFKASLLVLAAAFAVVSLARPRWGTHWEEVQSRGVDIFLALDISKSMLAEDIAPNRLERAKHKIVDFLRLVQGDRVGLIAFAGTAFVQCPLTLDYAAIEVLLSGLDPEATSSPGTNLAEAVNKAFGTEEKNHKDRALVLLTDGENLEGDPLEAARRAKERGVKVYAIGIGRDSGAPIPDSEAGGFKKNRQGEVVLTRLDETGLQNLALSTGGSYVRSVAGDEDLAQILRDLHHHLEDQEWKGGRRKTEEERYQIPLFLALICVLWEVALSDGKVFGVAGIALLFFFPLTGHAAGPSPSEARAGEEAYRRGDYNEAITHLLNAQIEDPSNSKLRYDLADAYYKAGKFDEAAKLFGSSAAGESADAEVRQRALYNLGNSAFRENKLDDAAKAYEEALKMNPQDEDAKYNLGVVKQKQQEQKQKPQSSDSGDKKEGQEQKDSSQAPSKNDGEQKAQAKKDKDDEKKQKEENAKKESGAEKKKDEQQPAEAKENQKSGSQEAEKKGVETTAENKMSPDEANQWLSRLDEQRRNEKKQKQASHSNETDKDW